MIQFEHIINFKTCQLWKYGSSIKAKNSGTKVERRGLNV
jgi:hypothetical protein